MFIINFYHMFNEGIEQVEIIQCVFLGKNEKFGYGIKIYFLKNLYILKENNQHLILDHPRPITYGSKV